MFQIGARGHAGRGRRHPDGVRRAARRRSGVRAVPVSGLAAKTGLKPRTVRDIPRHQPTSE
jgi:hypothetical protein